MSDRTTHYHAMAGLCGCMPNVNDVCETYRDAVDTLASLHDLGRRRTAELRRDGYLTLKCERDGNEYCEIVECDDLECGVEDEF